MDFCACDMIVRDMCCRRDEDILEALIHLCIGRDLEQQGQGTQYISHHECVIV